MTGDIVRVLLIEDDPGDARLVQHSLAESRGLQFQVRTAASLSDGLEMLAAAAFDIVLLDLSLPDSSPHETVECVAIAASRMPIVVLAGRNDEEFSRGLIKIGAQDYLIKGQFDSHALARAISYAIERKRTQLELAEARDAALEVSRLKSSFLAGLSHDIRTPMNAILGMTELLLETILDADQREFASTVSSSGRALLAIINDILDFSKVAAGKLILSETEFSPTASIESVIEILAPRILGANTRLVSFIDGEVPVRLRGDPGRLSQVLTNLVGNALKFSEHGEVAILVRKERETESHVTLHFTVNDSGPGIPPEFQEHLFDAFYPVDSSNTRQNSGTGLGLAISARLAGLMGGNIGVDSQLSEGASFWFTAAFAKPAGNYQSEALGRASLWGKRVLLVDENVGVAQWTQRQICSWGLQCDLAASGAEAIRILSGESSTVIGYDLVVIDLDSVQMNGLELSRLIQQTAGLTPPHAIAMYSHGQKPDEAVMSSAGISSSTSKPLRPSQLFNCFAGALAAPRTIATTAIPPAMPPAPISSQAHEELRARTRILLVEDDLVNQRVILKMLQNLGYRADAVLNGAEAINAVHQTGYDILLMDCLMPVMDGYNATRAIRNEFPGPPKVVIIGVTANALEGDREKCLAAGMDDYLSKPVALKDLGAALDKYLPDTASRCDDAVAIQPDASAIDMSSISRIADAGAPGGNFVSEIIDVFLKDMVTRVRAIGVQMESKDGAGLSATAHALKGSCGHFGAIRLMELCASIEARAKRGEIEEMQPAVQSMLTETERVRAALRDHQRKQSPV